MTFLIVNVLLSRPKLILEFAFVRKNDPFLVQEIVEYPLALQEKVTLLPLITVLLSGCPVISGAPRIRKQILLLQYLMQKRWKGQVDVVLSLTFLNVLCSLSNTTQINEPGFLRTLHTHGMLEFNIKLNSSTQKKWELRGMSQSGWFL